MDRNDKIAVATAAIITGSAILFAVQAKRFRNKWEAAQARIDAIVTPNETPAN